MKTVSLACLFLFGCAASTHETRDDLHLHDGESLYLRLGGRPAIEAVVEAFVNRVAGDARINQRFSNTDVPHLKMRLVEQICQAGGGPCIYRGKDMRTAHAGMNLREEEFTALVEDLIGALNQFHVGKTEQDELLGALGGMKSEIVAQ